MTSEQAAYLAGIFDGEGHIGIVKHNCTRRLTNGAVCVSTPYYHLQMGVVNTCLPLLQWLKAEFGGFITLKSKVRKQCYEWKVSGSKAMIFLQTIKPFVRIKSAQILLALDFQNTFIPQTNRVRNSRGQLARVRTNPQELERRANLHIQMCSLNQGPTGWLN